MTNELEKDLRASITALTQEKEQLKMALSAQGQEEQEGPRSASARQEKKA